MTSSLSRRSLLGITAAVVGSSLIPGNMSAATEDTALRPFRINVSEELLVELRRRAAATRWPDRETAQSRLGAAFKRGFQTRDAEMDPARLLGDLG
jgi:hypothetical protein